MMFQTPPPSIPETRHKAARKTELTSAIDGSILPSVVRGVYSRPLFQQSRGRTYKVLLLTREQLTILEVSLRYSLQRERQAMAQTDKLGEHPASLTVRDAIIEIYDILERVRAEYEQENASQTESIQTQVQSENRHSEVRRRKNPCRNCPRGGEGSRGV